MMKNNNVIKEAVNGSYKYRLIETKDFYPILDDYGDKYYDIVRVIKLQVRSYFLFIGYWVDIYSVCIDRVNDSNKEMKIINDKYNHLVNNNG